MRRSAACAVAACLAVASLVVLRPPPAGTQTTWSADPLAWLADERVLFVGNSLLDDSSAALRTELDRLGVTYHIEAHRGSSLADADYDIDWNWMDLATDLVASFQPTVVVVEACCNYWPSYPLDAAGHPIIPGSPAFRHLWEAKARQFAQILTSGGAQLWWVVTPPTEVLATSVALVDPINDTTFAQVHTPTPGVPPPHLIRWDLALTGGTGVYRDSLVIDGKTTLVRSDGLHLTAAGGALAARSVLDAFAGAPPPTPWGPFETLDRIDRFALQELYGRQPYDPLAAAQIGLPARYPPGLPWLEHLRVLVDDARWGGTARPVGRLYRAAFGRAPDADGLRWWTHEVAGPEVSLLGAARRFAASAELADRFGTLSDPDFVSQLYRNVLQREPDESGLAYWRVVLASGTPRSRVLLDFSESAENKEGSQAQVESIVVQVGLLGDVALPTPAWGDPPADPAAVLAAVAGSAEFTARAAAYIPRP